jgi:hypothetical protein
VALGGLEFVGLDMKPLMVETAASCVVDVEAGEDSLEHHLAGAVDASPGGGNSDS